MLRLYNSNTPKGHVIPGGENQKSIGSTLNSVLTGRCLHKAARDLKWAQTLKEAVDGFAGKSCYTVWSGPLVNKGQELFPICLRSSARPYLPFKL